MSNAKRSIDLFLAEIEAVCHRYGLAISHRNRQCGFIVEAYDEELIEWLRDAQIAESVLSSSDAAGLQPVPGNIYVRLHTADQSTSEVTYTNYAAVAVPRDSLPVASPAPATGVESIAIQAARMERSLTVAWLQGLRSMAAEVLAAALDELPCPLHPPGIPLP